MRPRIIAASALAVGLLAFAGLVAAVLATGGGEGGGGQPAIRIQQGLSVAALGSGGGAPQQGADLAAQSGGALTGGKGGDVGFAPFAAQQQQGQTGITVQGYGSATADADSAVLQLYFGSGGYGFEKPVPQPYPYPGSPPVPGETPAPVKPIEEADLQAVIAAIVAQGVPAGDIEFTANPYYDPYFSNATLTVKVGNVDSLDAIVKAATDAAAGLTGITLQNSSVSYTVKDCAALEKAALQAAVDDAKGRATAFAQTLGVGLGAISGASAYSYSAYGGTACGDSFGGPYPLAGSVAYATGQPSQVQVAASVSITYAIQ